MGWTDVEVTAGRGTVTWGAGADGAWTETETEAGGAAVEV